MPYLVSFCFALFGLGMVVDTQTVMNKFHPDDVIPAVIEFYLDIINLFLNILRILNYSSN
ncbi:hypothetical protein FF38_03364 [Lucilia cuprina]|uniref:Uncharacterized protein n=1 Tax=Lucilia cuprina TaxID=7375 RepID=A0A0L0CFM6_LUCCU|nr:hypothetical protein FF38_03364 [Lucilia cuprina]